MTPAVALWPGVVVRRRLADYAALTKPRVVAMVLVTTATGYYLGSAGTRASCRSSTRSRARRSPRPARSP